MIIFLLCLALWLFIGFKYTVKAYMEVEGKEKVTLYEFFNETGPALLLGPFIAIVYYIWKFKDHVIAEKKGKK